MLCMDLTLFSFFFFLSRFLCLCVWKEKFTSKRGKSHHQVRLWSCNVGEAVRFGTAIELCLAGPCVLAYLAFRSWSRSSEWRPKCFCPIVCGPSEKMRLEGSWPGGKKLSSDQCAGMLVEILSRWLRLFCVPVLRAVLICFSSLLANCDSVVFFWAFDLPVFVLHSAALDGTLWAYVQEPRQGKVSEGRPHKWHVQHAQHGN